MYVQVPLQVLEELKRLVDSIPIVYQHVVKEIKEKLEEITALRDVNIQTASTRTPPTPPVPRPLLALPSTPPVTLRPPATLPQSATPPRPSPPPPSPGVDSNGEDAPPRQIKRPRRRRVQKKISQVLRYLQRFFVSAR